MASVAIIGNTYPVKDAIKALGGRWNAADKAWLVPAERAMEAQALVAAAPKSTYSPRRSYARRNSNWSGCSCGSQEGNPRDSDCASCQHDY